MLCGFVVDIIVRVYGFVSGQAAFLFLLCMPFPCYAASFALDAGLVPGEVESRADKIFRMTKCLVCSGESLRDSQAQFAVNMRELIRGEILSGRTDDEILADLKGRYGRQILSFTPYEGYARFLWALPLLAPVVLGALMFAKLVRIRGGSERA
ncbi:cytochrome c-type biogenesis protein [Anaplasma marginale]|uniref:cytochrome c-type biogenesis protein n=1 Tax=Anaplasma marginale TaxID=770 RepID=UPI001F521FD5|nr:cytochrome c-type biogenesis protein CcmH [Anaplasma marginale]